VTPEGDEPTAQAQAIMERVLGLVRECRMILHALEHPPKTGESSSAEAERILYFTLMISRPRISVDTSLGGMMLLQGGGNEQTEARPEGHGRRHSGGERAS
jgi:hypothetical protein